MAQSGHAEFRARCPALSKRLVSTSRLVCFVGEFNLRRGPVRRHSYENSVWNAENLCGKIELPIFIGPSPQFVPIFTDFGVHRIGLRATSNWIGEHDDIAV